ncbi:LytTR family transcriptional regulator DNA-binding domain-containing protein [Chitinophaga horti]|uniref:LytTR family transcriptional regulator DNA-binding domain-containing protein n=1 Tax=Chitinophaga horti TaxID=2920382 RepID=UPI003D81A2BE
MSYAGGKHLSGDRLRDLETLLPETFVRIHRSYIVNLEQVAMVEKWKVSLGGMQLPIGEVYREGMASRIKGML